MKTLVFLSNLSDLVFQASLDNNDITSAYVKTGIAMLCG